MIIIEFIKSNINKLLDFKGIESVRYGVSKWTGSHIVEITPSEVFNSTEFLTIESSIVDEFEILFPMEELIFISDSDLISLTETLYCESKKSTELNQDLSKELKWSKLPKISLVNSSYSQFFNNEHPVGGLPLAA